MLCENTFLMHDNQERRDPVASSHRQLARPSPPLLGPYLHLLCFAVHPDRQGGDKDEFQKVTPSCEFYRCAAEEGRQGIYVRSMSV